MPDVDQQVLDQEDTVIRAVRIDPVEPTDAGLRMLGRFYAEIYMSAIADPNERESLANMQAYIEKQALGWFGLNNYHVLVATIEGTPIGGIVADYFAEPNAGMIELLAVAPAMRRQGLATQLHQAGVRLLEDDANRAHGRQLNYVFAEIRNPRPETSLRHKDTPGRVAMWGGFGYRLMDFRYIQPPLSSTSEPVRTLSLIAKPMMSALPRTIDAKIVKALLRNYLIWAMRIEHPEGNLHYRSMCRDVDLRGSVSLLHL